MTSENPQAKLPCKNPCGEAYSYTPGFKGSNADKTKILLVGNCADSRICQLALFNHSHLEAFLHSSTGATVKEILKECGRSLEDVYFTNIFKCLLPGDRNPSREEYRNCSSVLALQIKEFQPREIIAFGQMAYAFMFPEEAAKNRFQKNIGQILYYQSYASIPVLVSHHPSKLITIVSKTKHEHYRMIAQFLDQQQLIL